MIFEIIRGGGETDWVGKEWAGLFFPRGKNGPGRPILSAGKKLTGGKFWPVTPGHVAQSVTCLATDADLTAGPGVVSLIPVGSHTFVRLIMK